MYVIARSVRAILAALPSGSPLPDQVWRTRHRGILSLLWLHVPVVWLFAVLGGHGAEHAAVEASIVAIFAIGATCAGNRRRLATVITASGLLACSSVLVHLSHGLIEMHFHFFVMVGVVTLYQNWWPFLSAIAFVVLQHGIAGAIDPTGVFNHHAAVSHPWRWAAIHGFFILGMSAAGIISWRLNEALLASATERGQRLSEAQRVARLGSWEWDLHANTVTWSEEMYRLGGTRPGAFTPTRETFLARVHPDDRSMVEEGLMETASTGRPRAHDFRIIRRDGTIRWMHSRWAVVHEDANGETVIAGTTQDVTERREAEISARQTMSLLTATLDSTADGILVVDCDGRITSFNRQFATMWRLPEELLNSGDDDAAIAHVVDQVADPDSFVAKVRELYAQPDAESRDEITFKDGRFFERNSKPQLVDGAIVGRVWSFRDVTDRKVLENQLAHQAFHDALTGLANQALFRDRLAHASMRTARSGDEIAVVFVDVDHFKTVNDSLGHTAGDELLVAIASRISEAVRDSDTAARLGGDEFAVLIEDTSRSDVITVVERVLQAIREPAQVAGREVTLSASIGIAFDGGGATVDKLLANADLAMYTAKSGGRNRYEVFEPGMHTAAVEHLEVANDLRRGCERGEIVVHYQPIVRLSDEKTIGVEALVRWDHPTRGLLAPAAFIGIAEETGLIDRVGWIVLEEACRQVARWRVAGIDLIASVNLSARQLADPMLAANVADLVRSVGIPAEAITLELTESALMENTERTVAVLKELRSIGLRLAVDDFGTGYSSLSYLQHFPIDVLKIDRSFIANMGDGKTERSLGQAIVTLAASLGLTAVAEGVETAEQAELLSSLGCPRAQGFFYSRPVPAAAIEELLVAPAKVGAG